MKSISSVRQQERVSSSSTIVIESSEEYSRAETKLFIFLPFPVVLSHWNSFTNDTMSMLWLGLYAVFQICTITSSDTGHQLIEFPAETLHKLRVRRDQSPKLISYLDFELLNEYQCAIECVKDKAACTGYAYDAGTKVCSLFNDPSRPVDMDVIALVSRVIRSIDGNVLPSRESSSKPIRVKVFNANLALSVWNIGVKEIESVGVFV